MPKSTIVTIIIILSFFSLNAMADSCSGVDISIRNRINQAPTYNNLVKIKRLEYQGPNGAVFSEALRDKRVSFTGYHGFPITVVYKNKNLQHLRVGRGTTFTILYKKSTSKCAGVPCYYRFFGKTYCQKFRRPRACRDGRNYTFILEQGEGFLYPNVNCY